MRVAESECTAGRGPSAAVSQAGPEVASEMATDVAAVTAVGALDDPTRRALYELVAGAGTPLTRDAAAGQLGIPRSTATFHLERLAEVGLLQTTFAKLTGRTGPGSGRPAKLYSPAPGEIAVTMPPRHYDLAATVLAAAVECSTRDGRPVDQALADAARQAGRDLARGSGRLMDVLQRNDFRPRFEGTDRVVLTNCPFHRLAADHPQTVCLLNLHLVRGAAAVCGEAGVDVALEPAAGRCCVTLRGLTGRTAERVD